nr:Chain B, SIGNALING LYMPHOCYTIC ACTIVATION MOLECULE [synthetic construct]1M27_B Chain B, Signaling lymphocytic activation molecule [synthetic construct]
KSLTIYAQVQK